MVGHLAGVKISKNAYKILFIKSEGKYLRDKTIRGRYVERTVKLPSTLIKLHALITYGEVEVCMHAFLTAGVVGNGWLASSTRHYIYKVSMEQEAEWASEPV